MGADELINGSVITLHEPDSIPLDISVVQALLVVRRLVACLFIWTARRGGQSTTRRFIYLIGASGQCLGEKGGPSDIRHCKAAFYGKVIFMSTLLILILKLATDLFSMPLSDTRIPVPRKR